MKVLIDIPKESYDLAKECKHNGTSKYNWCLSHNDVVFMIANGTPISDNATNGDIIKAMFPNIEFKKDHEFTVWGYINDGDCIVRYDIDWWNAPYKRGEGE